jgi:endonuclease YncB( thermonuclease family)
VRTAGAGPLAFTAAFSDPVVRVLDGDTFDVLHNTRAERIRLNGIDRPEKGQAYGTRAKQAASLCGIKKGRPDQVDPLFIILI